MVLRDGHETLSVWNKNSASLGFMHVLENATPDKTFVEQAPDEVEVNKSYSSEIKVQRRHAYRTFTPKPRLEVFLIRRVGTCFVLFRLVA